MSLLLNQLDGIAPRFVVPAQALTVFTTPEDFYARIKDNIARARNRIFLATLYIGSNQTDLISALDKRLSENKSLTLEILTDGLRGTREHPTKQSSASLVAPLAQKYPQRVRISQYRTPALRGLIANLLPKRINEGLGLQHMKLYGFDERIILSGANLSTDYFTNRQDRYIEIEDKKVSDYYYSVFDAVSQLSWRLWHKSPEPGSPHDNFELGWVGPCPDPTKSRKGYFEYATKLIGPLLQPQLTPEPKQGDTVVYPVCQFTPLVGLAHSNELAAIFSVVDLIRTKKLDYTFTAGYFNVSRVLRQRLLATYPARGRVIVASEEANGFHESKGVSRFVPELYSHLTRKFLIAAQRTEASVQVLQWKHGIVNTPGGWSYHAKGIWAGEKHDRNPFLTVVGSSNYTKRSYTHDLEAGAIIVTSNETLKEQLGNEIRNIERDITLVQEIKPPRLRARLFVGLFGDRL